MSEPTARVRLTAGVLGKGKVEAWVENAWRDISPLCYGAVADVSVGEVTTVTLRLDTVLCNVNAEGVLADETIDMLEKIVKAHREAAA